MAVTAAVTGNTPNSLSFIIDQDGAAGTTWTISNAILAAAAAAGTPIGELVRRATANQAAAQRVLQGIGVSQPPDTDKYLGKISLLQLSGAVAANPTVLANAAASLPVIDIVAPAAVGTWLLRIEQIHSLER